MQHIDQPAPSQPGLQHLQAYYDGLQGVSGAMRINVPQGTLGTVFVNDGNVEYIPGRSEGTVTAFFEDPNDIRRLYRGEINPVVAGLQRRVLLEGDMALGARIIFGLHTKPFTQE